LGEPGEQGTVAKAGSQPGAEQARSHHGSKGLGQMPPSLAWQ